MKRIDNFEEYKALTAKAREKQYTHTNCYFLPAAVKEKIGQGCLYAQELKKGLLLVELDKIGFYRVFYFLSPYFSGQGIEFDRDAVIEFPFVYPLENDIQKREEPALIEQMGFSLGRESAYLNGDPEKLLMDPGPQPEGIELRVARQEQAQEILNLFSMHFSRLYAYLPTVEELTELIEREGVFVACKGDIVAGTMSSKTNRQFAIGNQVAVHPDFRGLGLGKSLMAFYHQHYRGQVRAYHSWIDIHNTVSVNMHRKLGYEYATPPRRANEYILCKQSYREKE